MNKIAPQDVQQHLMLNQTRLSTAEFSRVVRVKLDSSLQLRKALRNKSGKQGGKNDDKGKMHKGLGF